MPIEQTFWVGGMCIKCTLSKHSGDKTFRQLTFTLCNLIERCFELCHTLMEYK